MNKNIKSILDNLPKDKLTSYKNGKSRFVITHYDKFGKIKCIHNVLPEIMNVIYHGIQIDFVYA